MYRQWFDIFTFFFTTFGDQHAVLQVKMWIWSIMYNKDENLFRPINSFCWIVGDRLKYFDACVSSVAYFASGHRAIYKKQLQTVVDAVFRKFCRNIVLPPPGTDWSVEWHEIFHAWNERVQMFMTQSQIQTWATRWCNQD